MCCLLPVGFHRRLYWKRDLQSTVSIHLGNFSSDNYIKKVLCAVKWTTSHMNKKMGKLIHST